MHSDNPEHGHAGAPDDAQGESEPRAVVLVEGVSDRAALEVIARRRGRDLEAEGVQIVVMNGVTNFRKYLARYRAERVRVAGLYDEAEERFVRHEVPAGPLAEQGFFGCSADLEDEFIRAIGESELERVVEQAGDTRSFRTLRLQPALRDRGLRHQFRRLIGGRFGAKERYAALMAEMVELSRVPAPLDGVLEYVREE